MNNKTLMKAVNMAVIDVMSIILGFDVSECLEILDENIADKNISGVMILLGDKKKLSTISMSEETSKEIVSYMIGVDPSDISKEELYDGAAELVNMILGRAKLFLRETGEYFEITPPFTVVGESHDFILKNSLIEFNKVFVIDNIKISITIFKID